MATSVEFIEPVCEQISGVGAIKPRSKKKKPIMIALFLIVMALGFVPVSESFGADSTVKATLPTFGVQMNGTIINSKAIEYPFLVYKDITYMPMTYDYCNLLGLSSKWSREEGLVIALKSSDEIPTITENPYQYENPAGIVATLVNTPVTVNGKKIDNTKEPYPFLMYKDITYFPLTFRFTKEEFNIDSTFQPQIGLGVFSENKFIYKYYPESGKLQHTDLRISSILYQTAAINISDGSQNYPSNNVKLYDYWKSGKAMLPLYGGVKYYGYVSDGKGGLKANTLSKLGPFGLTTTEMTNIGNTNHVQVELTFSIPAV